MSGEQDDGQDGDGGETGIALRTRTQTKKPSLYKVLILNDDYTPMEFVVFVIERFFNKSREEATRIMLHVHQHGVGLCGVFTYEVPRPRSLRFWIWRGGMNTRCNARWKRNRLHTWRPSPAHWNRLCAAPSRWPTTIATNT